MIYVHVPIASSTAIASISYDPASLQLMTTYIAGGVYIYFNVYPSEIQAIVDQELTNKEGVSSVGATHYYRIRQEKDFVGG